MAVEEIKEYCKNKHKSSEEFPFGEVPICKWKNIRTIISL